MIGRITLNTELGGEKDLVALGVESLGKEGLVIARAIDVGGVPVVQA